MADISITATAVVPVSGYGFVDMVAGEAVARGKPVYTKAADGLAYLASCETTSALATVTGIALNDGAANQPVRIMTSGNVAYGSVFTVGMIYVLSASGAIAPHSDLASSDYVSVLGVATTATNLRLAIINSGVEVP
jgi:hypothetical protein